MILSYYVMISKTRKMHPFEKGNIYILKKKKKKTLSSSKRKPQPSPPTPSSSPLPSHRPPSSSDPPSAFYSGLRDPASPPCDGDRDRRWSNLGGVAFTPSRASSSTLPPPSDPFLLPFLLPNLHSSCWYFCCSPKSLDASFLRFSPTLLKTRFVSSSK